VQVANSASRTLLARAIWTKDNRAVRARRYSIAALATLFALLPAQAWAGVHMSPASPAGQEYVIPFASARTFGGAPAATSVTGTTPPAVPFGVGIRPVAAAAKKAGGRDRAGARGGPSALPARPRDRLVSGFVASFADSSLDLLLVATLALSLALAMLLRRVGQAPSKQ
jgi:hypothetical protein